MSVELWWLYNFDDLDDFDDFDQLDDFDDLEVETWDCNSFTVLFLTASESRVPKRYYVVKCQTFYFFWPQSLFLLST